MSFSNNLTFLGELDQKNVEQLFNKYRDPNDPQKITSDGVVRFLEDLQLSPGKFLQKKLSKMSNENFISRIKTCPHHRMEVSSADTV
jgi:hypothetical protein